MDDADHERLRRFALRELGAEVPKAVSRAEQIKLKMNEIMARHSAAQTLPGDGAEFDRLDAELLQLQGRTR